MQLRQIEVFCKVAERKSFSKAAEDLFMTQPGVSFHIRALEESFGAPLFVRQGREVRLSEVGLIFYPYAVRALHDLQQGLTEARAHVTQQKQTIVFGCGTNLAISYLLPAMGQLVTQINHFQIQLHTGVTDEIVLGLQEQRYDLGLVWGPLKGGAWCTHRVAMDYWVLIFPPDSPLHDLPPESAEAIAHCNQSSFVLPATGSSRKFAERILARCGIQPRTAMRLTNAETIAEAVMNGNGVGLAPWKTVEERVRSGKLGYHVLNRDTKRPIVIAYLKKSLQKKPHLQEVAERISSQISAYMAKNPNQEPLP